MCQGGLLEAGPSFGVRGRQVSEAAPRGAGLRSITVEAFRRARLRRFLPLLGRDRRQVVQYGGGLGLLVGGTAREVPPGGVWEGAAALAQPRPIAAQVEGDARPIAPQRGSGSVGDALAAVLAADALGPPRQGQCGASRAAPPRLRGRWRQGLQRRRRAGIGHGRRGLLEDEGDHLLTTRPSLLDNGGDGAVPQPCHGCREGRDRREGRSGGDEDSGLGPAHICELAQAVRGGGLEARLLAELPARGVECGFFGQLVELAPREVELALVLARLRFEATVDLQAPPWADAREGEERRLGWLVVEDGEAGFGAVRASRVWRRCWRWR